MWNDKKAIMHYMKQKGIFIALQVLFVGTHVYFSTKQVTEQYKQQQREKEKKALMKEYARLERRLWVLSDPMAIQLFVTNSLAMRPLTFDQITKIAL